MKYSFATNFDNRLIEQIAQFGTVESVYGKFASDIVGGGRSSFILPKISDKTLREHLACCHAHGIRFNYLLNASCLQNAEVSSKHHKIFAFVESIVQAGVDSVTVGNMNLLRMMRQRYPDLPIATSVFLETRTVPGMKKLEELGVNEITMHFDVNRDFRLLKKLVEQSKPNTKLRLIANNTCLHGCIDAKDHAILASHTSQSTRIRPAYSIDPYRLNCDLQKIMHPTKLLSSDWIRPEDVHFYDEIGQGKIILKLTDRSATTAWLISVIKAYSEEKKEGNLLDILLFTGNRQIAQIDKAAGLRAILQGNVKGRFMKNIIRSNALMPVYLDNRKLDGFLAGMQTIDCRNTRCHDQGWLDDEPAGEGCNYCRTFAMKAITIDAGLRQQVIEQRTHLLRDVYAGKLFR